MPSSKSDVARLSPPSYRVCFVLLFFSSSLLSLHNSFHQLRYRIPAYGILLNFTYRYTNIPGTFVYRHGFQHNARPTDFRPSGFRHPVSRILHSPGCEPIREVAVFNRISFFSYPTCYKRFGYSQPRLCVVDPERL